MVGNTEIEKSIKQNLLAELDHVRNNPSNSKVILAIETFFKTFSKKSIVYLFSVQGVKEIQSYLEKDDNSGDIVEFLLRFKTTLSENNKIYSIIMDLLQEDTILDSLSSEEFTKIKVTTPKELEKFYVVIVLYVYNNIVITNKRKWNES